jgi:hypothetical protein
MNRIRSLFKITSDVTAYRDQEEGYAEDPYSMSANTPIWAAAEGHETRMLAGKEVTAVLFTIGSSGLWYWMPRSDFNATHNRPDLHVL